MSRQDLYETAIYHIEDAESIYKAARKEQILTPDDEEEIYMLCRKAQKIAKQLGWDIGYHSHVQDLGIYDLWDDMVEYAFGEGW